MNDRNPVACLNRACSSRWLMGVHETHADIRFLWTASATPSWCLPSFLPDQINAVSPMLTSPLSNHLTSWRPATWMFHLWSSWSSNVAAPVELRVRVFSVQTPKPCFLCKMRDFLSKEWGFRWMTTSEASRLPLLVAPPEVRTLGAALTTLWCLKNCVLPSCVENEDVWSSKLELPPVARNANAGFGNGIIRYISHTSSNFLPLQLYIISR